MNEFRTGPIPHSITRFFQRGPIPNSVGRSGERGLTPPARRVKLRSAPQQELAHVDDRPEQVLDLAAVRRRAEVLADQLELAGAERGGPKGVGCRFSGNETRPRAIDARCPVFLPAVSSRPRPTADSGDRLTQGLGLVATPTRAPRSA